QHAFHGPFLLRAHLTGQCRSSLGLRRGRSVAENQRGERRRQRTPDHALRHAIALPECGERFLLFAVLCETLRYSIYPLNGLVTKSANENCIDRRSLPVAQNLQ